MKRYLPFLLCGCLLHASLLLLFLQYTSKNPLWGGGSGSIQIELVSAPLAEEGRRHSKNRITQNNSSSGADLKAGTASGSGNGTTAGPGAGPGSGTHGPIEVLAEIRKKIERAKRFPALARRLGLSGVSTLSFQLTETGALQNLALANSSGTKLLDDAALATVRRAAPFPYYPHPIQVAIRFELR